MKLISTKSIEIFTDGTVHFLYTNLKPAKQTIFYEKDVKNSLFYKKPTKTQRSSNLLRNSYKSKYKF
jgi:hypothetical protein